MLASLAEKRAKLAILRVWDAVECAQENPLHPRMPHSKFYHSLSASTRWHEGVLLAPSCSQNDKQNLGHGRGSWLHQLPAAVAACHDVGTGA